MTFVAASRDEALEVADEQVDALFDEGWAASDIALITLGQRHPVQAERQAALGQQAYWEQYWDTDDIFYGHVLGFKGMERRAVVLCVNEDGTRDRAAERRSPPGRPGGCRRPGRAARRCDPRRGRRRPTRRGPAGAAGW